MSRVSVIIPAYQAADLLDTALASVAAQERPADEVVVVDDGSTDGTAEVASRWSELLPLEVIVKKANEGLGTARRDAVARSTGDLVALLDADDAWLPDHLSVMLDRHAETRGIVLAQSYRWFPGTRLARRPSIGPRSLPPPDEQPLAILDRNFAGIMTLFERRAYDRAGGFRPLRLDEDWDLWIRMVRAGERFHLAPTVTALRRYHGASLSSSEACLEHDLALLREVREQVHGRQRHVVDLAIRRREARRLLFEGYDAARQRDHRRARAQWWRAALHDRSLRAPLADGAGSVTLRALACLVAPGRMVTVRDDRAADPDKQPVLRIAR